MEAAIIEHDALLLPEAQRALLADRLLQSLGTENEAITAARGAEADAGLPPGSKVKSRMWMGPLRCKGSAKV